MEPGKRNQILESGGILLVESGVQLKESRIRDCLGFHLMGRDKFVSPLIVSCLISRSCSQCQHQREASFFKLKNPTQSTGYDEIPPRVLKLASNVWHCRQRTFSTCPCRPCQQLSRKIKKGIWVPIQKKDNHMKEVKNDTHFKIITAANNVF